MKFIITDNMNESDHLIISVLTKDQASLDQWNEQLKQAARLGLPAKCANPDQIAPQGDEFIYTPGTFARKYEILGGKVDYYGKPYTPIYRYLLNQIPQPVLSKSRILAIGDSMATDITGAFNYGIDSLLLLGGVHPNVDINSSNSLEELFSSFQARPSFIMARPK